MAQGPIFVYIIKEQIISATVLYVYTFQDVSNNRLQELPQSIGFLTKLFKLLAANNGLRSIPKEIGSMDGMVILHFTSIAMSTSKKR